MVLCSFNFPVGQKLIEKVLDINGFIKSSKLKHYQVTTIYIPVTNTWVIEYHHIFREPHMELHTSHYN